MDSRRRAIPITILAMAGFVVVTTEFIIIGFLPQLAADFGVSVEQAGLLVSLFAFTVVIAGPVLTPRLAHLDRRNLFAAILLVFAAANTVAALAPNIWVFAAARFLPAVVLPVFWGTASDTAATIAGPGREARSVAGVYLGISAAMVFGVPLGTIATASIGWRGSFASLAVAATIMAVCIKAGMPPTPPSPRRQADSAGYTLLKERTFLHHVTLSVLIFTAMFTAYTFLSETVNVVIGVDTAQVGWWLMAFGAVGLLGNWLGGWVADRLPIGSTVVFTTLLAAGMAAVTPLSSVEVGVVICLGIWGMAYTGLFPVSQIRVMKQASNDQALAATVNVSAANAGAGLGAVVGGVVIDHWGIENLGYAAAGIAMVAALYAVALARLRQRTGPATEVIALPQTS